MISRDIRQEAELQMLSASTRIRRLLSAVENQIISSPAIKFRDFLDILHNEPSLGHLATKLEETYSKLKFSVSSCVDKNLKVVGMVMPKTRLAYDFIVEGALKNI